MKKWNKGRGWSFVSALWQKHWLTEDSDHWHGRTDLFLYVCGWDTAGYLWPKNQNGLFTTGFGLVGALIWNLQAYDRPIQ